ncbi:hypothetical protein BGZ89_007901 [Linnemannia elongata]|nr:hypothetical protein BGZ89_007901 [Linnemannia elongata]
MYPTVRSNLVLIFAQSESASGTPHIVPLHYQSNIPRRCFEHFKVSLAQQLLQLVWFNVKFASFSQAVPGPWIYGILCRLVSSPLSCFYEAWRPVTPCSSIHYPGLAFLSRHWILEQ